MTIIGLAGYAGSGKNAVVSALHKLHGGKCVNLAFAKELKNRVAGLLRIDPAEVERRKAELRPLLVESGSGGRLIDPFMWVYPVAKEIRWLRTAGKTDLITVSDARYVNEGQDIIGGHGGHIFYLERPGIGPANDEERNSIAELRRVLNPVVVTNTEGHPEIAAATILEHITKAKVNV